MGWLDMVEAPKESDWHDILVVGDSPKLMGLGRRLADQLGCYLKATACEAKAAISRGADRVIVGPLEDVIDKQRPEIVLFEGPTQRATLAQQLKTGIGVGSVDLDINRRLLVIRTPRYGGKVIDEWVCPDARPQMAVVETANLPDPTPDPTRTGDIITL